MSTDSDTTNERHVSGTIGLTDAQLQGAPIAAQNTVPTEGRKSAPGPDGMALAAEALFDIDGRGLRSLKLLQHVNTKRLRSIVHGDITAAEDLTINRGDDHVSLAYSEAMKVAGYLSAAIELASDSELETDLQALSGAAASLLLQTRAVLARRAGENVGTTSGDSTGQ